MAWKNRREKEGTCHYKGVKLKIIDLPGIYSLTANSVDELIARDYIIKEKPDVIIDIVDASNLERNLYLTLQLLELEANLVIALNKFDVAENLGYEIDVQTLSKELGVPVIPTVATEKKGVRELLDATVKAAKNKTVKIKLKTVERLISKIQIAIKKDPYLSNVYPSRWLAIKILEGDEEVLRKSPY